MRKAGGQSHESSNRRRGANAVGAVEAACALYAATMAEGEIYVTFPSRAFGAGNDQRRYFDYLRPAEPGNGSAKALKDLGQLPP